MVMTPDERKAKRTAYAREWRANNPERVNAKRRLDPEAHNAYQRAYRASRPGKSREYDQRYRAKDVERRAVQIRRSTYKRLYGITPEDYDRMFSEQGGVCCICGDPPPDGRRLHVDHQHVDSAPVRGLLCYLCNSGLGMFRDDPVLLRKAARYLNEPSGGAFGPPDLKEPSLATVSGPIAVPTALQAANTLGPGNGASIDLTGAARAILVLTSIAGTAGIYTFEISRDGGTNWDPAAAVRSGATDDATAVVAATPAGAPLAVYKVDQINGPALLRARISTAWVTNAPAVTAYRIG